MGVQAYLRTREQVIAIAEAEANARDNEPVDESSEHVPFLVLMPDAKDLCIARRDDWQNALKAVCLLDLAPGCRGRLSCSCLAAEQSCCGVTQLAPDASPSQHIACLELSLRVLCRATQAQHDQAPPSQRLQTQDELWQPPGSGAPHASPAACTLPCRLQPPVRLSGASLLLPASSWLQLRQHLSS